MTDTKLVTVGYSGLIRELGASGPIKHPTEIRMEAIKQMVLFGKVVYEHNPANPSDRVLLTVDNVELDNFAKNEKDDTANGVAQQTSPAVDQKKDETPAAPVVPDPIPDPVDPGKDDTTEDEKKDETPVDPVVNTNEETAAPETADDTAAQNQETTETAAPAVDEKKDETPAANATTGKKSSKKNNKK